MIVSVDRRKIAWLMNENCFVSIICVSFSDWLVFGRDFTVRTITMETVLFGFFFRAPAKFKLRKRKKIKKERFGAGTKLE